MKIVIISLLMWKESWRKNINENLESFSADFVTCRINLLCRLRQQLLIHSKAWKLLGWEGAASVTETSRWKGWTCSFPRAVDSRTDFQVRMGITHRVQTFAVTIRENSWSLGSTILRYSSRLARAESTTCNEHSSYRQPQSQTVYCYLKITPSMGALTVLDDCRVTMKKPTWGISQDICLCEILPLVVFLLGRVLNPRDWQWEVWSCRCMRGLRCPNVKQREKSSKICRR